MGAPPTTTAPDFVTSPPLGPILKTLEIFSKRRKRPGNPQKGPEEQVSEAGGKNNNCEVSFVPTSARNNIMSFLGLFTAKNGRRKILQRGPANPRATGKAAPQSINRYVVYFVLILSV